MAQMLGAAGSHEDMSISTTISTTTQFTGLRVLLAEDNEFNRTLITTWLRAKGVAVDQAHDGLAAVRCAHAQTYDLILMDIHMPLLDGVEAARQIRAGSVAPLRVPIIALTADVFADDRAKLLSAGLDDCVFKPVDEAILWAVIARWTGRAPQVFVTESAAVHDPAEPQRVVAPALPESLCKNLHGELRIHLEQLRLALAAGDANALYEHAHKLNGVAGYFGIQALAHAAGELERTAQTAQLDAVQPLLDIIEREVTRALAS